MCLGAGMGATAMLEGCPSVVLGAGTGVDLGMGTGVGLVSAT